MTAPDPRLERLAVLDKEIKEKTELIRKSQEDVLVKQELVNNINAKLKNGSSHIMTTAHARLEDVLVLEQSLVHNGGGILRLADRIQATKEELKQLEEEREELKNASAVMQ